MEIFPGIDYQVIEDTMKVIFHERSPNHYPKNYAVIDSLKYLSYTVLISLLNLILMTFFNRRSNDYTENSKLVLPFSPIYVRNVGYLYFSAAFIVMALFLSLIFDATYLSPFHIHFDDDYFYASKFLMIFIGFCFMIAVLIYPITAAIYSKLKSFKMVGCFQVFLIIALISVQLFVVDKFQFNFTEYNDHKKLVVYFAIIAWLIFILIGFAIDLLSKRQFKSSDSYGLPTLFIAALHIGFIISILMLFTFLVNFSSNFKINFVAETKLSEIVDYLKREGPKPYDEVIYYLRNLFDFAIFVGMWEALSCAIVVLLVQIVQIYLLVHSTKLKLLNLRITSYEAIEKYKTLKTRHVVSGFITYSAYQAMHIIFASFLQFIFLFGLAVFISIASFKVYANKIPHNLFNLDLLVIIAIVTVLTLLYKLIVGWVFVSGRYRLTVINPNVLTVFSFITYLFNFLLSVFYVILKLIIALLNIIFNFGRLDKPLFCNIHADFGHRAYLGFIYLSYVHKNPILEKTKKNFLDLANKSKQPFKYRKSLLKKFLLLKTIDNNRKYL